MTGASWRRIGRGGVFVLLLFELELAFYICSLLLSFNDGRKRRQYRCCMHYCRSMYAAWTRQLLASSLTASGYFSSSSSSSSAAAQSV